jgi:hypothetical protein
MGISGSDTSRAPRSKATRGPSHQVDLRFELPLVTCQRVLESLPRALVPKLTGMRLAGSLAAKGHVRFDTAGLPKSYDVDWDGSMSCRVVQAPLGLAVSNLRRPFAKTVYTPRGEPREMQFGPDTPDWTPGFAVSRFMEGAVLTCEDGRFFRHHGFDQEAVANSLRENLVAGRFVRGASTISMQLAKNLYLPRDKTLARKLQEAVLTIYLEQELTKREILELYLNVVEFGPMVYGIGPAARHYFNTGPSSLSLGQAMYLGSILRNPNVTHFGAGGAVSPAHMRHLRRLMKIANKIGRVTDEELEAGLRETVIYGSPSPMIAPPEPEDLYAEPGQPDETGEPAVDVPTGWAG